MEKVASASAFTAIRTCDVPVDGNFKLPFTYTSTGGTAQCLKRWSTCFGCGTIHSKGPASDVLTFSVWSMRDLESRVIPFFEHSPLLVKDHDFRLFADIVRRIRRTEHMTDEGFEQIVRSAYAMNDHGEQRSRTLDEVLRGSSETARQAPAERSG